MLYSLRRVLAVVREPFLLTLMCASHRPSQGSHQLVKAFYAFCTHAMYILCSCMRPASLPRIGRQIDLRSVSPLILHQQMLWATLQCPQLSKVVCACALTPWWSCKVCCACIEARAMCIREHRTSYSMCCCAHMHPRCAPCQYTWPRHGVVLYIALPLGVRSQLRICSRPRGNLTSATWCRTYVVACCECAVTGEHGNADGAPQACGMCCRRRRARTKQRHRCVRRY